MNGEERTYAGRSTSDRARERRERFLDAAVEIFGTDCYAGSSVPQICRTAGLSSRQFYQEFTDREHLLRTLYDTIQDRATEAVAGTVLDRIAAGADLEDVLDAGVRAFVDSFHDPRTIRIAFVEVVGVSKTFEEHRRLRRAQWADLLQSAVSAGAERGLAFSTASPLQWTAYIGAVNATIVERSLNPDISQDDIVLTMRTLLRPGIVG